jgi:hypothetical protein
MNAIKTVSLAVALALLAGCGSQEEKARNQAVESGGNVSTAGASASLAGLYEGGTAPQRDQLCMVERGGEASQFGLIVWGTNDHSCMGAGEAVRQGERLLLRMAGDSACEIEARIVDGAVTLPSNVPEGCSYYCGARARFAARTLTRTGDDALKARDLVGDPLCG